MSSIKSRKNRRKPLALSLLLIVALIVPQVAFAMGGGDAAVSNGSATIAAVSGVENVEGGQVDVSENRAMDATPSDVGAQGAASSENTDSAKPSGERAPDGIRNDGVIQNGGGAQDGGKGHDGSGALDSTGTSASFPSRGIGPLSEVGDVGLATFTIASSSTTAASSISAGYTTSQSTTDQLTVRATYVITAPVEAIDAKVEIKLSNVDDEGYFERAPWNGNHVYFRIDEAGIGWPTAAQNRKVEVDGDDITVSFTVSDTEGSTGTITLPYNFNGSTFGGWLPKEKTIARVITGGDIAAPKALTALASPNVGRSLIFNASPNTTEINLGQARRLDLSVSQYGATSPWLSEPGTSYTMTLTYPRNATLVIPDKPYYGLADYSIDESDPDTNTVTWDLGNVGQDGVASGSEWYRSGTYLYAGYSMPGFNITFPSGVYKNGDSVTLCATLTSTYAGAATPTTTTNTKTFKLVDQAQVHMNPIASFNFSTRLYLKKGDGSAYSYFPYSAQNSGTAPVPEAHYTWYNDVDKTGKKLNVSRVTVANIGVRFQAKLVYYIAGPGGGRQAIYYLPAAANAGTTNQPYADTSAVPGATLGAGEYIDRIEAWPLGNGITETVTSANEDRALPTGASMRFTLSFLNWPGDAYPDGRAVKNNDFVMTKADLEWKGERRADLHTGNYVAGKQKDADDSYTMKLSTLNSESYSRAYFVDNPVIPSVQWQYQRGQEGIKNPGTEIGMNLRFYSLSWSYANNPWKNPILYYLPPNAIEIDTTQTLNVFNGNADGTGAPVATASIEKTTVQGKRAYKIEMNKPMTLAATTATSVNAKFIPITVKLREDATSGNIYFNHTNGTGYPDTSGLLFGVSEASPFTIPANYGTFYQDTNDLDGNPNTPILVSTTSPLLNVTQLDGMSVIAEMLNNRLGDTPVWQNVNITGAEATVATNAGGEGKFSLTLKNNGNSYLGGIRLLDILPFVGDKTVCTPTQPKGSQWAAVLKEKLDVKVFDSENKDVTSQFSGAYTISYGTKGDPDYDGGSGGIVRSGSDGAFSGSTAFNASTAYKSFLFNWNSTTKRLPPNHKLVITGVIKAPAGVTDDDDGKVAYNAFASQAKYFATSNAAASTGTTALLSEPKKQMFILADLGDATISKGGYVFKDYNGNGLFDTGVDVKYADVAVERYKADASGKPTGPCLQTVATDGNGQYAFFNVKGGNYVIKIVKPYGAAYSFAARGVDAAANASHVDADGFGNRFTLNASAIKPAPTNAGIKATGKVTVQFCAGTVDGAQVGSDAVAVMPPLGAPDVDGNNAIGTVTVGTDVMLPAHYHLKGTEVATKSYALTWDEPSQAIVYVVEPDTCTVSYHANKPANATGEVTSVSGMTGDMATYEQGFTLKANDFSLPGYDFGGWNTNADGTSGTDYADSYEFAPWNLADDLSLYAKWTPKQATVTLDANGGDTGGAVTATYDAALPSFTALTRTGYALTGYYTQASGGNKVIEADGTLSQSVDGYTGSGSKWANTASTLTLYAQWSANPNTAYTVQHYQQILGTTDSSTATNYAIVDGAVENKTGTTGAAAEVASNSWPGFTFQSGMTTYENHGVPAGNNVLDIAPDGSLAVKLYYSRNSYNVSYSYSNNPVLPSIAPTPPKTVSAQFGATVTVALDTATTLTGYTFSGWGTEDANVAGGSFAMPANAVAFTGNWTVKTHNIIFNSNGGAGTIPNLPIDFDETKPLTKNSFERDGYEFAGWNTNKDASSSEYADKANYQLRTDADVTLYAVWTPNPVIATYTLTVIDGSGGGSYVAGAQASIAADPAPLGHVFDRWESDNGGAFGDPYSPSTTFIMPAGATTVTATYKGLLPITPHVEKDFGTYTGVEDVFAKVDADYASFLRLLLEGKEVPRTNYMAAKGSTVITLCNDYLKTFENGTYWFTAEFTDNRSALIKLVVDVKAPPEPGGDSGTGDVPNPGDGKDTGNVPNPGGPNAGSVSNPGSKASGGSGSVDSALQSGTGGDTAKPGKTPAHGSSVRKGEPKVYDITLGGTAKAKGGSGPALWRALIAMLGAVLSALIFVIIARRRKSEDDGEKKPPHEDEK